MQFDAENQLCAAQAFVATAVSASSYKKQSAAQDLSIGRRLSIVVFPTVAAGAGSTHVLAAIQADDDVLTTNVEVLASQSQLAAAMIPGAKFAIEFPPGSMTRRYLGFKNTITGGTTEVTLDVYIVPSDEIDTYKSFPKVVGSAL